MGLEDTADTCKATTDSETQKHKLVSRTFQKEQREPRLCYFQDSAKTKTKPTDALFAQDGLGISEVSQQGIQMTETQLLIGQGCFILTTESRVTHRKPMRLSRVFGLSPCK